MTILTDFFFLFTTNSFGFRCTQLLCPITNNLIINSEFPDIAHYFSMDASDGPHGNLDLFEANNNNKAIYFRDDNSPPTTIMSKDGQTPVSIASGSSYADFHTIDWQRDLARDRSRHKSVVSKGAANACGYLAAMWDASSGWICVLFVGIASGWFGIPFRLLVFLNVGGVCWFRYSGWCDRYWLAMDVRFKGWHLH